MRLYLWYALAASLLAMAVGCAPRSSGGAGGETPPGKLLVAASILPMADFARQVGGDRVEVKLLVPAGASPHTYEPTPAQLEMLNQARVLVLNGVGLEFWAEKLVTSAGNPNLVVVRTADGLDIMSEADEHGAGGNPHVWLDPLHAIHQVEQIRDAFAEADPKGESIYAANAAGYIQQLQALDSEIGRQVAGFRSRKFIAFHAAWVYFARRYRLEQAAVVERSPGREPSPTETASIVRAARSIGARAIFAEYQFPTKAAEVIAAESGSQVLVLDPLGVPPDYSYIETMRYNVAQMAKAMR